MQHSKNSQQTYPDAGFRAVPASKASWARALDLSSLAKPTSQPATGMQSEFVLTVTEQSFETDVVEASQRVPIVLDFWAQWCEPCKQLSPVLERQAVLAQGAWLLAKIDIEASPGLARAFRISSVPMVMAIAAAQPIDGFSGVLDEPQLRSWLTAVLEAAAQLGVRGAGSQLAESTAGPSVDERFSTATARVQSGDLDGAEELFHQILASSPAEEVALAGLAQVKLLRRLQGVDAETVLATAGAPEALTSAAISAEVIQQQCQAADVEFARNQIEVAFARLVTVVRYTSGDLRNFARNRLLELLSMVPGDDPAVRVARRNLSNALF